MAICIRITCCYVACFEHRLKATLRNKHTHENISKSKISLWSVEFQTSPAKDFVEELQGVHQYALIFTSSVFGIINNLLEWKSYYSVFSLGEENYVEKCGFHLHKWKNKQKKQQKSPTQSEFIRNPKGPSLTQNLKPQLTDDTSVNCKFYFWQMFDM